MAGLADGSEASEPAPQPDATVGGSSEPRPWRRRLLRATLLLLIVVAAGWGGLKFWIWTQVGGSGGDEPLIGASLDTAWHARLGISNTNYQIAMARSGGRLEEVRPGDVDIEKFLDRIDGLLLTGGGDIDPALYGGDTKTAKMVDRERDDFEVEVIRGAMARDMPILGICRGIQILNVIQGGTLQDLRSDPDRGKRHGIGGRSMSGHEVTVEPGSHLAEMLRTSSLKVNSFHGQAVDRVGTGLVVVARAEDGVIEGLELPGKTFVVTTQWHPEIAPQQTEVFDRFLDECRDYRRRKAARSGSTP